MTTVKTTRKRKCEEGEHYRVSRIRLKMVREGKFSMTKVRTPGELVEQLTELAESDREQIVAIFLDIKNVPLGMQTISVGTLNFSVGHPREIFKGAILCNANSLILAHNHPSGDLTPSTADDSLTRDIAEAGKLLDIRLLDHVIVGPNGGYFSYSESRDHCLRRNT